MKKSILTALVLLALATTVGATGYHGYGVGVYAAPVVVQSYAVQPVAVATCGSAYSQNLVVPQIAPLQGAVNVTTQNVTQSYSAPVVGAVTQAYTAPVVTQAYAAPAVSLAVTGHNYAYGHAAGFVSQNVVVRQRLFRPAVAVGRSAVVVQRQAVAVAAPANAVAVRARGVAVRVGNGGGVAVNAPGVRIRVRR
jgi:hypothetical protein